MFTRIKQVNVPEAKAAVLKFQYRDPVIQFISYHRAFTCSKSTKETVERGVDINIVLVFLLLISNIFHTFNNSASVIKTFPANVPLPYPQKSSENQRFSEFFRGYRSETLVEID